MEKDKEFKPVKFIVKEPLVIEEKETYTDALFSDRGWHIAMLSVLCFVAGLLLGWSLHG
jgi:hypothetical protein